MRAETKIVSAGITKNRANFRTKPIEDLKEDNSATSDWI